MHARASSQATERVWRLLECDAIFVLIFVMRPKPRRSLKHSRVLDLHVVNRRLHPTASCIVALADHWSTHASPPAASAYAVSVTPL